MAIKDMELMHGAALHRLLSADNNVTIKEMNYQTNGFYLINNEIPIYIKHTTKRLSPWRFTFNKQHQDDFEKARRDFKIAYMVFVCWYDGICCIEFEEFKHVLDNFHEDVEWVAIKRNKGEKYAVSGKDGILKRKVADGEFPKVIMEMLY